MHTYIAIDLSLISRVFTFLGQTVFFNGWTYTRGYRSGILDAIYNESYVATNNSLTRGIIIYINFS